MRAEVITIGSEILAGHTWDTNFTAIASALTREGIAIVRHTVVPDERSALTEELGRAFARGGLLIATGGLGATPDDLTRRVVASVLGRKLMFRENLAAAIREKLQKRGLPVHTNAETMALLPAGAHPLANRTGLAPGFRVKTETCLFFALPGVPEEMRVMLAEQVVPYLRDEGLTGTRIAETLRTVGISETTLAEWAQPLSVEGVEIAYLPCAGRVDLRLTAAGDERGRQALAAMVAGLQQRLGAHLFATGEVSLEAALLAALRQQGLMVAVAESLTGGRVGATLTRVPGSSQSFLGSVTAYSDDAKQRLLGVLPHTLRSCGAVSAETAVEMAAGVRQALGADVAVATTGIAGPSGGSADKPVGLVFFALSDSRAQRAFRYLLGGNRAMIQERSVTLALNLLRLHLLGRLDLVAAHEQKAAGLA